MEPSDKIPKDIIGLAKYVVACAGNESKTRQKRDKEECKPLVEIKISSQLPRVRFGSKNTRNHNSNQ